MLMSSSKLFLFSKEVHFNSGVRLLLELYCAVVLKHVAFFTILAKLTVVFTCTGLPLNLYTSVFGGDGQNTDPQSMDYPNGLPKWTTLKWTTLEK